MRRTQVYLDQDLWDALQARARAQRTTVSNLVTEALRERYLTKPDQRRAAMQAFVGIGAQISGTQDGTEIVRTLRRGRRLDRLAFPSLVPGSLY